MRSGNLPVLPGYVAADAAEVAVAVAALGGGPVVVKAQVPAGGRGKAGGVKVAADAEQAVAAASAILKLTIGGFPVQQVLVERAVNIAAEFYFSLVLDRTSGCTLLVLSGAGGMEIEETAARDPAKVVRLAVDAALGVRDFLVQKAAFAAGLPPAALGALKRLAATAYRLYQQYDAVLLEINPLVLTSEGNLLVLDAKMEIDDNALFRQPEFAAFPATATEHPLEQAARGAGLAYVKLAGDVGVIGNGAGLVMATLDMIKGCGGRPANFLDIGGGARADVVRKALNLVLADTDVRSVLINVFGGITRCDEVARGLLAVAGEAPAVRVPVVVRLAGTRAEEGWALLAGSAWATATSLLEAAEKAVAAAAEGGAAR